jgi:protein-glutamine gamma-glutamyltransferase
VKEYLPLASLLRLLAVLLLAISPHFVRLPLWESALIVAVIVWRGLAAYKQWCSSPTTCASTARTPVPRCCA